MFRMKGSKWLKVSGVLVLGLVLWAGCSDDEKSGGTKKGSTADSRQTSKKDSTELLRKLVLPKGLMYGHESIPTMGLWGVLEEILKDFVQEQGLGMESQKELLMNVM